MRDLDYQGLDLPILTEQELLEQTWNLEEQPRVEGQDVEASGEREAGQPKRARDEEEGSESSSTKRPRVDVEVPQEETLNVATEPPEMPAAPVRSGEVPKVLVTPAVAELPKRRTSPQQLDLEQAALDPGLVLPEPVPQDVAEPVPQDRVEVPDQCQFSPTAAPAEVPQADAPGGDFLQPLIPGGGPRREGRGRKKVNDGAQVAEEEVWGEQLARFVQEALRRRVRAPKWGWGDQGGEEEVGVIARDAVAPNDEEQEVIEGDRQNALGVSREVEREGQDTLNIPRDISNTSTSRRRDGSLRDSLQPETAQVGDLSGQEERAGDGVQPVADLLQPDVQPNLNVTPVQLPITGGERGGLDVTPHQPEAEVQGDVYQGHEVPPVQEQEQSLGGVQIQEEVQVTEFSLLALIQDLENNGEDPVTFTSLCPLSSTRCMKAATTFQGLLKLETAGKVVSTQEENFAEIIVSIV